MHESYSTNRLPCAVCQVKSIQCFYQNRLSSCEGCRKSKIRCIKQMPLGQHNQISPTLVDTSIETTNNLGKTGERGIIQHRSVVDLTPDAGVAGPIIPVPNAYPGPLLKCRKRGKTDDCAWCLGPNGYRFLCETYGHQHSTCKLENAYPNAPPPLSDHRARQSSPALNEKPEIFNGDGAVFGPLVNASSGHHSTGQKRKGFASVAIGEEQDVVKRTKNIKTSRRNWVRQAWGFEKLTTRNEVLEDELKLLKSVRG